MRLVEELEYKIGSNISNYYWDTATDHANSGLTNEPIYKCCSNSHK